MKALSGIFSSWSHFFASCCRPVGSYVDEKPRNHGHGARNTFAIIHDEPSFMPPPSAVPSRHTRDVMRAEPAPRKRRGTGWSSFSSRKWLLPPHSSRPSQTSKTRRPQISKPTNFRHVYSESFQFPASGSSLSNARPVRPVRPGSFHPLELNIRLSDTRLSPILPNMDYPSPPVTPPPRVYTASTPSGDSPAISHVRSYSSMSFHIPRRPVNGSSFFDSPGSDASIVRRPQPTRVRGHTTSSSSTTHSPLMEDLVARVAHAMLERDRLQERIDDVIERQSIYISSRPSTAYGQPGWCPEGDGGLDQKHNLKTAVEMEPMPEIPALPPDAPSFSERLGSNSDIALTAPAKQPGRTPYQANSSRKIGGRVPPPPLPLRLRPPLRKKKSFSRVSSWLFPAEGQHKRDISLESLTNAPKPVSGPGVFYEVAHPGPHGDRPSFDTDSTVSDWTVEDEQTMPTSLSPSSAAATTPRATASPPTGSQLGWRRPVHFQQRKSVGVAC